MPRFTTCHGPWKSLPGRGGKAQVFAIGDVHGQADALAATLDAIAEIPRRAERRILVFTGDIIDRGPANRRAVRFVEEASKYARVDEVVLLPGNHEMMLLDGLQNPGVSLDLWLLNGGQSVVREGGAASGETNHSRLAAIAREVVGESFIRRIADSSNWHEENDLLFVHAGIHPREPLYDFLRKPRQEAGLGEHWAWIREPFLNWRGGWDSQRKRVVVHGHTPALCTPATLEAFSEAADCIETHRRICLDAGAALNQQIGWAVFEYDRYTMGLTKGISR